MIDRIETAIRWLAGKCAAYFKWQEERSKRKREKALNDHHTFEICIIICAILIILEWCTRRDLSILQGLLELAAIVCFGKFVQFAAIGIDRLNKKRGLKNDR
jgi:hypothetical protein